MNESVVMVRVGSGLFGAELETTIFRPSGAGPFPAVVINHGKAPGNPVFQERSRHINASREFVRRGYVVVLPMRLGFSKSSGSYISPGCNIASNGEMQAEWVEGVLQWMRAQPYIDGKRLLVAGQSQGGLATMALGARNPEGVRGLLNFAGGLKVEGCIWESALADAFERYGARSRLPSLWFYGDNDGSFPPAVWKDLHARYTGAGGNARLVAFGAFPRDAHGMFASPEGLPIWVPEVEKFLEQLGLPSKPVIRVSDVPRPPKSGFAAIDDIGAVPRIRENGRRGYTNFLKSALPRAFALGPAGQWGWAAEGDDPTARALADCQKITKDPCKLYAVDDDVVWRP